MKKRNLLALFVIIAVIVSLLSGCSAAPNGSSGNVMAPEKLPSDSLSSNSGEGTSGSGVLTDRKLIRKIQMNAETEEMDALLSKVYQRVNALEGYIESRNIQNGSSYHGTRSRSAVLTIRIPAEKLDQFVEDVSSISNIVSTVETSDDVTLKYVSTESRLKVLRAEEERLLEFLSKATSVSEMITLESRLTEVQAEIESTTSQLKVYDNLVDYGTITLTIDEVKEYTVVEEEEPTLWDEICGGFSTGAEVLMEIVEGVLVVFAFLLPFLLPIAIVFVIILLIVKSRKRK